jgi:IclR family acetate operon transcriptional repressor
MQPADRYRVPILDRALELLELLATHPDGLTLTAMTERLSMPKNSVFRIATTLTLRGYAVRDESSKAYRISPKLLSLAHQASGAERITSLAAPILTALRDATGETALLGTLSGQQGVVLDQVPSSHPVKVVVEIGHSFPLHTAAPAKAILAFLPPERSNPLIGSIKFTRQTRHTLTSATAYLEELEQVRDLGFALDRGEESETFACAAAPVFDRHQNPIAALWISGPADRVTPENLPSFGAIVKRYAGNLSAKLGHNG